MIFETNPAFDGVEVSGNGEEYFFKTKLFSHSSVLLDSSSNIIVPLTRSNWWRMDFKLVAKISTMSYAKGFKKQNLLLRNQ